MQSIHSGENQSGGIYFHIPFCKQACHYCDFHFVTSLKYKEDMLQAMYTEMVLQYQKGFLDKNIKIESIYFGGGTPSILDGDEIKQLIDLTMQYYDCSDVKEITLEANPDDLSHEKVLALKNTGVNRFSIGVQSFFDEDLGWMNRAHRAEEAEVAIKRVLEAGFSTITADLIYGYPLLSDEKWEANIDKLVGFGVSHISAYSMTVEPRTTLGHQVKKGQEKPMNEDQSAFQFEFLMDKLAEAGYHHYEISNWSKAGQEAVHNSNYWKGMPYLGIGPSAHSFEGNKIRQWNINNNAHYIKSLQEGWLNCEREELTLRDKANEYVMTSLRTSQGLDLGWIQKFIGNEQKEILLQELKTFAGQGFIETLPDSDSVYTLTRKGKLMADRIASELFFD